MKKQKRHLAGQWQRFTRFIPETAPEGVRKAMRVAFLSGAYAIVEKALDQGSLEGAIAPRASRNCLQPTFRR